MEDPLRKARDKILWPFLILIMTRFNVQIEHGKPLSANSGLTVSSLKQSGYEGIFIGIGNVIIPAS